VAINLSKYSSIYAKKLTQINFKRYKLTVQNKKPSLSLAPSTASCFCDDGSLPVTVKAAGVVRTLDTDTRFDLSQAVATVDESMQ